MDQNESRALIVQPERFLADRGKTLDERLAAVQLPSGSEEAIASKTSRKIIRDRVLGMFKVGQLVKEVLDWNDNVDSAIREAKKNALLGQYFDKCEDNSRSVSDLRSFLTNPQGNTLFNKILRILDDSPPDEALIEQLSSALQHIIDADFVSLFEEHKYALTQIERVSPPALAILADHENWPLLHLKNAQSSGPRITSDWLSEFHRAYTAAKGISDPAIGARVRHSLDELINLRIVEAYRVNMQNLAGGSIIGDGQAQVAVADLGQLLLPYITKTQRR